MEPAAYPPKTLTEIALELDVPVSQRNQPDFSVKVPSRFVTLAEAKFYKLSWTYDPALGECRLNHLAARRTSNVQVCSDCIRLKEGKDLVYGKSRAPNKHYTKTDTASPVLAASPAQELPRKEQELIAALDESRDFDKAAAAIGWTRPQLEARLSVSEPLKNAVDDLVTRRAIPRTRKAAADFQWSKDAEHALIKHWIDGGLLHLARDETGVSASEYFSHVEESPTFAAMVEAARPRALEALKDRSLHAAGTGNTRLLEYLTKNTETDTPLSTMTVDQLNNELLRLITRFEAQGLINSPAAFINKKTGETIDAADLIPADDFNSDLVSA